MQTNTVKKHKKRKKLSFPQQNWMKLSESLSFDVYNMHAKAGKWVFRAPEFILKRGVTGNSHIYHLYIARARNKSLIAISNILVLIHILVYRLDLAKNTVWDSVSYDYPVVF